MVHTLCFANSARTEEFKACISAGKSEAEPRGLVPEAVCSSEIPCCCCSDRLEGPAAVDSDLVEAEGIKALMYADLDTSDANSVSLGVTNRCQIDSAGTESARCRFKFTLKSNIRKPMSQTTATTALDHAPE
jgi:hypothetical protein